MGELHLEVPGGQIRYLPTLESTNSEKLSALRPE